MEVNMKSRFLVRLAMASLALVAIAVPTTAMAGGSSDPGPGATLESIQAYGADAIFESTDASGCQTWADAYGSIGSSNWAGNGVVFEQSPECPGGGLLAASMTNSLSFQMDPSLQSARLQGTVPACLRGDPSNCFDVTVDLTWTGTGTVQTYSGQPGTFQSFGYHINSHGFTVVVNGVNRMRAATVAGSFEANGVGVSRPAMAEMYSVIGNQIVVIPS